MINLSQKAAKRFGIKWTDLKERSGDFWKVDVEMIARVPLLFIVHEYTLFTLVRRKTHFKTPLDIAEEIRNCCPCYQCMGQSTIGKNGNKKLTGSINEMKRMTWGLYRPDQINAFEMSINNGLYSYLSKGKNSYGRPFDAVNEYRRGHISWL